MTTLGQLASIAARHGLPVPTIVSEPWIGAASRVYPIDDVVVKIPFDRPDTIVAVEIDAAIATFARSLGVAVPELLALDETRELVPVPVAIFRRVEGAIPLDRADRSEAARAVWEEVGRQLARVHAVADRDALPIVLREFRQSPEVDPRPWVDELRERGVLLGTDAGWLRDLLDRIAPAALAEVPLALCHGDVNAANVLVDAGTGRFRALIDWAGAGWLDPVWDFAGVPLDVVPWLLAGHRELAPLPDDATAEARILWSQVQMRLFSARSVFPDAPIPIDVTSIRQYATLRGW
jgi:aminoglycoside phosphotransferase (APT) family kinase protein